MPEEQCTRKTKNGDSLKMHYRYPPTTSNELMVAAHYGPMARFSTLLMIGVNHSNSSWGRDKLSKDGIKDCLSKSNCVVSELIVVCVLGRRGS